MPCSEKAKAGEPCGSVGEAAALGSNVVRTVGRGGGGTGTGALREVRSPWVLAQDRVQSEVRKTKVQERTCRRGVRQGLSPPHGSDLRPASWGTRARSNGQRQERERDRAAGGYRSGLQTARARV